MADSLAARGSSRPATAKGPLAVLFFLHGGAMAAYTVPLANVLKAHGIGDSAITLAFCTGGVAAFISPMMAGSLADRRVPPERLLAWLCLASAAALVLTFQAIGGQWGTGWVLGSMMTYALCAAPGFGLLTSIVLSRLTDARREFGPLRAMATGGWMAASYAVALLQFDFSPHAGYLAAAIFAAEAGFCFTLRPTYPLDSRGPRRWRDFFGWEALRLLRHPDHRIIFLTSALLSALLSTFYRYSSAHLADLGNAHPSRTMGHAQFWEALAMLGLGWLLTRFRLKWVLLAGLLLGTFRLALMTSNSLGWLAFSIALHGPVFVLFYPTSQIYLEQRVDHRLRAKSQALLSLVNSGLGNLSGYLLITVWHHACTSPAGLVDWPRFWTPLTLATAALSLFFLATYRGHHRPDHS